METGSRYNFADIGILGFALMASPTFGDAIDLACRYAALTASYLSLVGPEVTNTEAVVAFDDAQVPRDVRRFLLERDFAIMLRTLPLLLGAGHAPITVRIELVDLQLPTDMVEIENLTVVVEETSRNALVIPAGLVTQPMPAADPQTAAICIRQCEELLNRRHIRRGISAAIRTRLIQDSARFPRWRTIAKEMMHHRTHAAPPTGSRGHQLPRAARRGPRDLGRRTAELRTQCRGNRTPARVLGNRRVHPGAHPVERLSARAAQ